MRRDFRVVSMLMVLLILLGSLNVSMAGKLETDFAIDLSLEGDFKNNKDLQVKIEAKNQAISARTGYFVVALYEEASNKLITYNYLRDSLEANASKEFGSLLVIPEKGDYKIKAFVWEDMKSARLISNISQKTMTDDSSQTVEDYDLEKLLDASLSYQTKKVKEPVIGTIGGEWTVIAAARANYKLPENYYQDYLSLVEKRVVEEAKKTEARWENKVTDVERVILALASLGEDPANIAGINLYDYIVNKEANFPALKNPALGDRQGANELIYGLLALDAKNYSPQGATTATRESMINKLIDHYQMADGSFSLIKEDKETNLDITAMAIQALAPYYSSNSKVKAALDRAIDRLSRLQEKNGDYIAYENGKSLSSSEALSQIIIALNAMGIDPASDERFVKDSSILDALIRYRMANGGFKHSQKDTKENIMATDQAIMALGSQLRFTRQENTFYNMLDVKAKDKDPEDLLGKISLSIEKRTLGKGDILTNYQVDLEENDSVWSILERVEKKENLDIKSSYNEEFDSVYISSIKGDGEFDHGPGSGWKYQVNGSFPDFGVSQYKDLKAGDHIRLRYCLTPNSQELSKPLVDLLKEKIQEFSRLKSQDYSQVSYENLQIALEEAKLIGNDPAYASQEDQAELLVSQELGKILKAKDNLVRVQVKPGQTNVPEDFENDLWLSSNFKVLNVGETYQLTSRRVPEIISNAITNDIHHPDYSYSLLEGDSIEFEPTSSQHLNIKAVKEGISIIEVAYKATEYVGKLYGPVSDINKSYLVVDVRADKNDDLGMDLSTDIKMRSYDTIYYSQGSTVDYNFQAYGEGADSLEVSLNGRPVAGDGNSYSLPLENRSNIIGIKAKNPRGEKNLYYVVDARKIEIQVENLSREDTIIRAGDQVRVGFKGITMPVYKLGSIYNPTWYDPDSSWGATYGTTVRYTNSDLGELITDSPGQWDLAQKNALIFRTSEEKTYDFTNGYIYAEWWGSSLGADKDQAGPGEPNLNAPVMQDKFSLMPDFSIDVKEAKTIAVDGLDITDFPRELRVGDKAKISLDVRPKNTTEKEFLWESSDEAIVKVNNKGEVEALGQGQARITVTSKEGVQTTCSISVDRAFTQVELEQIQIKELVDRAKALNLDDYIRSSRYELEDSLSAGEEAIDQEDLDLDSARLIKDDLDRALDSLVANPEKDASISALKARPGDRIEISLPNLQDPKLGGDSNHVQENYTIYSTDLPGLEEVKSENGHRDPDLIKKVEITIPETTEPGIYKIFHGRVYKEWLGNFIPQMHWAASKHEQTFLEGDLPDFEIEVLGLDMADDEIKEEVEQEEDLGQATRPRVDLSLDDLDQNPYDTYYYTDLEEYFLGDEKVEFIDALNIKVGGRTEKLKNKKISYQIESSHGEQIHPSSRLTIKFDGLSIPINSVSGLWNSSFAGEYRIFYRSNLENLEEIRSEAGSLDSLSFTVPEDALGEYTLEAGSIYEKANEWSPGIEGIGTSGYFGRLPKIRIFVANR